MDNSAIAAKYAEILRNNGILDPIAEVIVTNPHFKDQGGGSERLLVTVKFINDQLKPLHLFAKTLIPDNPAHTEIVHGIKAFVKEATFLTKYLPAAQELCQRKGVGENLLTDIFIKCYYGDEEMIVLENAVNDNDYVILGKEEKHDYETARFALTTLAKHHAVSYAMIQEQGGPRPFFSRFQHLDFEAYHQPVLTKMMDAWFNTAVNVNIKILELTNNLDGTVEAIATLQTFQNQTSPGEEIVKCFQIESDELQVLNHGDYWYANMLFLKDAATNKITQQKAFDFQMTRYNTPALDLVYYLFSSVTMDARQNNLESLLQDYLTVFNKVSSDLGQPTQLSYEKLLLQYRKKLSFGLLFSLIIQYGPGVGIFGDVDLQKVDMADLSSTLDKVGKEWIANNSEKARIVAGETVRVLKEYRNLRIK